MPSIRLNVRAWAVLAAAGAAAPLLAQDSVPTTPGGNDALSPYAGTSQRVRYVVDAASVQTSWGQTVLVAPVLKASRESDPLFRTFILGSGAVSGAIAENVSFASRAYSVWTSPGQGVHPTANSAPGTVARTGHEVQIGVGASEFGVARSGVLGALVGLDLSQPSRLYVERVMALNSRSSDAAPDTATLALGAVDATGFVALRADNFNTLPATSTRVLGENILRVNLAARSGAVNSLAAFGAANFASDAAATAYIISNEATTTNTPTLAPVVGGSRAALVFDFASRLRMGTTSGNLTTTTGHLHGSIAAHRGNPTFAALATLPGGTGGIGAVASPAKANTPAAKVAAINVFDLAPGAPGGPPVVDAASRRSYALPSPLNVPGYSTNTAGLAGNTQYLSQSAFRGGNGQVGVGLDGEARVFAMTISDPSAGESVVVVRDDGGAPSWTIAAHPGKSVLNSAPPTGVAIGALSSPVALSAPAVDLLGNVYFVASWQPSGPEPERRGLFKAVNVSGDYHLELLLATGQQIAGPNSGRTYTVSDLALRDGDSVASGAFHAQQLVQQQLPGAATADPASIFAAGGLSVHAVLDYDNAGQSEQYDAVLLVLPGGTATPECAADFDGNGTVEVTDIFTFLTAWFAGDPDAFEFGGTPGVPAIFAFLTAWFAGC